MPTRIKDLIELLRTVHLKVTTFIPNLPEEADSRTAAGYWSDQFLKQVNSWIQILERYLGWLDILNEKTDQQLFEAGLGDLADWRSDLYFSPSLRDMAAGRVKAFGKPDLEDLLGKVTGQEIQAWMKTS